MSVDVVVPESDSFLKDAPKSVELNLSRIESEYKITDYISLDQGLKNTIEWIKNYE